MNAPAKTAVRRGRSQRFGFGLVALLLVYLLLELGGAIAWSIAVGQTFT